MHTIRTLDGSIRDILDPDHRIINFGDENAVITAVTHIRALWSVLPPVESDESPDSVHTKADVNPWPVMKSYELNAERNGYVNVPTNPDTTTLDTPWRQTLAHDFNHVYYDAMQYVDEMTGTAGHFHPPNDDVFGIPFMRNNEITLESADKLKVVGDIRQQWDTNVLLIPAFLQQGLTIRGFINKIEIDPDSGNQGEPTMKEIGVFDAGSH